MKGGNDSTFKISTIPLPFVASDDCCRIRSLQSPYWNEESSMIVGVTSTFTISIFYDSVAI